MTAAQPHAAATLIPGAFEQTAASQADTQSTHGAAAATDSYVVAAPTRPTTRLGIAAAVLRDLAICMALIYGVALVPGLAVRGFTAAAEFMFNAWGR